MVLRQIPFVSLAFFTVLSIATAASAQVGCQLGGQIGGSLANTDVGASFGGVASGDLNGIGGHSTRPDAGVRAGCDLRLGGSPFIVGAFGEYNWQDVKSSASLSVLGTTVYSASNSLGDSYSVGGRAGVMLNATMPYLLVAYTHTDANWSVTGGIPPGIGLPSSFNGVTFGGGIEFAPLKSTPDITMALETRWTHYASENAGTSGVSLQPDQLQAMVRLNWNFGSVFADDLPSGRSNFK